MRAFLLFLLLLSLGALVWAHGWRPSDRFNPWAPIDLRAPPDVFFRYKLARLQGRPERCHAALTQAGADFTPVPDHDAGHGCGWADAVRLRGTGGIVLERAATVSCPLAASLVLLDRQVLQPAAQAWFGEDVRGVAHVGSYACRPIDHRAGAPLSQHARAQAIDLTGFTIADGRRLSVGSDWAAPDRRGHFLRDVHDRACAVTGMLLGPDYNRAHQAHFHLQASGGGYCR